MYTWTISSKMALQASFFTLAMALRQGYALFNLNTEAIMLNVSFLLNEA